jgi:amidase
MAPALLIDTHHVTSSALTLTPPESPKESQRPAWSAIARAKQDDRDAALDRHPTWRLRDIPSSLKDVTDICVSRLSPREREIVHNDATSLVSLLRERVYTATEVLTAFCKVATAAQDTTNCLTEIFFDDAFARARELDHHLEVTGTPVGPLHGVPISIKDHIVVRGQVSLASHP